MTFLSPKFLRGTAFCSLFFLLGAAAFAQAPPRVDLEVAIQAGGPLTSSQKWYAVLSQLGVSNLRIRSQTAEDKVDVQATTLGGETVYKVTGVLTAKNTLILPGGQFSLQDTGRIRTWLNELGENGTQGVTLKKVAFNLTPGQLQAFYNDLSQPVAASTKGVPPADAIAAIRASLRSPITVDPSLAARLSRAEPVRDELQNVSSGTALAAILRPEGGVVRPRKLAGQEPELFLSLDTAGGESWPVGWPIQSAEREVLPRLMEFLNVEIEGYTLTETLDVLQGRLEVPFVYDYNALAWQQIDPATIQVALPSRRTYYSKILQTVLAKSKLKSELRIDEAGNPLIWITTQKPYSSR